MASRKSRRRKNQAAGRPRRPAAAGDSPADPKPRRPELPRWRKWLFRLTAATLLPALLFVLLELGLRLFGYGYCTGFFVRLDQRDAYTTNQRFGWRFFPPAIARVPVVCELPAEKDEDTYRIFVLGSSAAMGVPDSAFGFGRMLEVMLQECYPQSRFEVVNAAMTAVNSHVVLPIARDCSRRQPNLFVVYMGNNEVIGRYGAGTVFHGYSPSLSLIRASISLRSTRIGQLAAGLLRREQGFGQWEGMEMFLGNRVAAEDPRLETLCAHFRANLQDICGAAHSAAAKVVLCTVAVNMKDCAPFASLHRADLPEADLAKWEDEYKTGVGLAETGEHAKAVEAFLRAEGIDDRFAELHFRLGRSLLALGEPQEARHRFVLACDLDALRFRADTRINEVIREVADERSGADVVLVDAERALAEDGRAQDGIPGRESFYEHVHLTPEGNYALAKAVFTEVVRLLPESVRGHDAALHVPPPERCFELLALTGWNRYRMATEIAGMTDRPPFTNQLDHSQQQAARQQERQRLGAEGMSLDGLAAAAKTNRAALERRGDDLLLRENYAKLLQNLGDYGAAAQQWRTLLERLPDIPSWRIELGTALRAQHQPDEAIAEFRAAMRANPVVAPWVHFNVGATLLEQHQTDEAIAEFRQALAIHPALALAHNSLGAALLEQGRVEEAMDCFEQALECDHRLALAQHNLGYLLVKQGDLSGAVEHYRQALEIDPRRNDTRFNLAAVLLRQKQTQQAIEQLQQAVLIAPQSAEARYRLANLLSSQARLAEADGHYREALRIDARHFKARHNLAATLARLGKVSEAIEQYRLVLGQAPDFPATLNSLARILATDDDPKLRDGAQAVQLAERACEKTARREPAMLDTLAAAYAEVGRFQDAVAVADEALRLARSQGKEQLAAAIEARQLQYKEGRPCRGR